MGMQSASTCAMAALVVLSCWLKARSDVVRARVGWPLVEHGSPDIPPVVWQALQQRSFTNNAPGFEPEVANRSRLLRHLEASFDGSKFDMLYVYRWSHYWSVYEGVFERLRAASQQPGGPLCSHGRQCQFVEIGVLGGGSVQVWADWFGLQTTVHGLDIVDQSALPIHRSNVVLHIVDQGRPLEWRAFFRRVGPIAGLIDDGGHALCQQLVTLREALPWVERGGTLAVEDTHTSFMEPGAASAYGGGRVNTGFSHGRSNAPVWWDNTNQRDTFSSSGSLSAWAAESGALMGSFMDVAKRLQDLVQGTWVPPPIAQGSGLDPQAWDAVAAVDAGVPTSKVQLPAVPPMPDLLIQKKLHACGLPGSWLHWFRTAVVSVEVHPLIVVFRKAD